MIKARKIDRVMLIFPPARTMTLSDKMCSLPMGIAYLGAVLRQDYEVKLLDAVAEGHHQERWLNEHFFEYGINTEQILDEIDKFAPQVVGITCLFSAQFWVMSGLVKKIKERFPEIITVTGGAHPSFMPEDSMARTPGLDFICRGESEESLPQLLRAIQAGKGIEEIDGIAWRDNGKIRVNPKTKYIENLDALPFPARDLLPMEKYFDINVPFGLFYKSARNNSFNSSRGCPFKCRFCSSANYWGRRIRFRSVESVLAEMVELKHRYGVEEIKFEDDNLLANPKRAKAIFRGMIERKFNFHWNMPNGVMVQALDDEELLSLMRESGCYEVNMAFESGDQYVADNIINKSIDLSKGTEITRKVKAHGIDAHAFFMLGFPGETWRQIMNTIKYIRDLPLDKAYIFMFNPLPGTELYEESVSKGLFRPEDVYHENYFLTGITTDEFTPEMVRKLIAKTYWYCTIRPLWRDPKKFFAKYVRRALRLHTLTTLWRIARTMPKIFSPQKPREVMKNLAPPE